MSIMIYTTIFLNRYFIFMYLPLVNILKTSSGIQINYDLISYESKKSYFMLWQNINFLRNHRVMKPLTNYTKLTKEDLKAEKYKKCLHASHCMIYAFNSGKVVLEEEYNATANILMQMRFDGHIGFPGGLVDEGESPEEAVTREMEEEMATNKQFFQLSPEDHVISHYSEDQELTLHFYAKEVSLSLFEDIEKMSLKSHDYGSEVMGIMRVPLYTMIDGFRGFPAFLTNRFIGNSKEQLIQTLISKGIMKEDEVNKALEAKPSQKQNNEVK